MKKLVTTIAISISMLASGVVLADAPVHRTAGEEVWIYHDSLRGKGDEVVAQTRGEHGTLQVGDVSPDRLYEYAGQEEGWRLRSHRYDLRGGRLVHVDDLPHDVPAANANLRREDYISPSDGGD